MNLRKKKILASKVLNVGKGRIIFLKPRLDEIKEAITKQDIIDLHKDGAIKIKEVRGRGLVKIVRRRNPGRIRNKVANRKQKYVKLTRKLRKYVLELKKQGKIDNKKIREIRIKIKNKFFKNKSHLKEQLNI